MYEPRIALIAEGPTDFIVIEAALKATLQRPFVLNQLQPEPTRPEMAVVGGESSNGARSSANVAQPASRPTPHCHNSIW